MTYVRRATPDDIPAILPLARAFHAESPHHRVLPFSDDRVAALITAASTNSDWCALIACNDEGEPIGLALYYCCAAFYSEALEVYDLTFWVTPTARASRAAYKLARAVLSWAASKGVARVNQGVLTQINHEVAVSFFERMGFEQKGVILVRS